MSPVAPRRGPSPGARGEVPAWPTTTSAIDMNRMTGFLAEVPENDEYGDFYVVSGSIFSAGVTRETAERIEGMLDRWIVPRWIVFHDRVGSRYRVRANLIRSIVESTAEQRAADRRHDRAREREEKEDRRPWDDD